jgi:hypothetical protein
MNNILRNYRAGQLMLAGYFDSIECQLYYLAQCQRRTA